MFIEKVRKLNIVFTILSIDETVKVFSGLRKRKRCNLFLGLGSKSNSKSRDDLLNESTRSLSVFAKSKSTEGIKIKDCYETAINSLTKLNPSKVLYNDLMEIKNNYGDITENGHGMYEKADKNGYVEDDD